MRAVVRAAVFIVAASSASIIAAGLEAEGAILTGDLGLVIMPSVVAGVVAGLFTAFRPLPRSGLLVLGMVASSLELLGLIGGSASPKALLLALLALKIGMLVVLFGGQPSTPSTEQRPR